MLALDAHPNIEIRIFNPFANRSARALNFLTDFRRVNRRMHNKSFTVDNQVTIIGGRNIGDEYFAANEDTNFGDLDVLGLGPVARDVSEMFDLYWNHRLAVPVAAVVEAPEDPFQEIAALRTRIAQALSEVDTSHYETVVEDILEHKVIIPEEFNWVPYELVHDSPDKADKRLAGQAETIVPPLHEAIMACERELIVISPYFVPEKSLETFRELRERGVRVRIMTNSLAANNHLIVHAGYAPSRKPLLEMGAELYEVRADAQVAGVQKSGMAHSGGTLHAKVFVVDRERVFLGTFNWDPRSAHINTEMGIVLDSPRIAMAIAHFIDGITWVDAYEVRLGEGNRLQWLSLDEQGDKVSLAKEPDTTWWQRFKVGFYRLLPIRGQL
jgi:putative cardiolipin synthase